MQGVPTDRELVRYTTLVADSGRWDGFELREGDIIISTPPKCGTTWTQMICALLVFQTPELPESLDVVSPWLDMLTDKKQDTFDRLAAQTHRRFIKTHTPFDGLPADDRVSYICVGRDPRDVAISMANHRANFNYHALLEARAAADGLGDLDAQQFTAPQFATAEDQFWAWITDDGTSGASSLRALAHHIESFHAIRSLPNVHMLHYDDLKRDLEGHMRALASFLAIEVDESRWPSLVNAASFESMKHNADRTAPDVSHGLWQSNADFFRNGTSGQWTSMLDAAGVARYEDVARGFMSDAVFDWLHRDSPQP